MVRGSSKVKISTGSWKLLWVQKKAGDCKLPEKSAELLFGKHQALPTQKETFCFPELLKLALEVSPFFRIR